MINDATGVDLAMLIIGLKTSFAIFEADVKQAKSVPKATPKIYPVAVLKKEMNTLCQKFAVKINTQSLCKT